MSRTIPNDVPLSDEDRTYLRQRGSWGESWEKRIDSQFPPNPDAIRAFNAKERAASITAPGDRELLEENARLAAQVAELQAQLSGGSSEASEDADEPVDFSTWLNVDLEAEIDRVNGEDADAGLKKGTKAEMVEALTRYFAE